MLLIIITSTGPDDDDDDAATPIELATSMGKGQEGEQERSECYSWQVCHLPIPGSAMCYGS